MHEREKLGVLIQKSISKQCLKVWLENKLVTESTLNYIRSEL